AGGLALAVPRPARAATDAELIEGGLAVDGQLELVQGLGRRPTDLRIVDAVDPRVAEESTEELFHGRWGVTSGVRAESRPAILAARRARDKLGRRDPGRDSARPGAARTPGRCVNGLGAQGQKRTMRPFERLKFEPPPCGSRYQHWK